jgi:hypothetical protein
MYRYLWVSILGIAAGSGSLTFNGAVGGLTPLGAITISSANNVTENGGVIATSLTQSAGTGTTTLNGTVITSGGAGINLTGVNLVINGGVATSGGGGVTVNESGTIASAATGDIVAGGAVSMTAGGTVTTAGDVGGTVVSLKGVGMDNSGVVSGTASVTIDAGGGGTLANSGTIANGGAGSTAPIVLRGDSMVLGGAITGHAAPVTLTTSTASRPISLVGAAGGSLVLSQAELDKPTTTGGLTVGDVLHAADITIGGTVATPAGSSGGFTINAGYDGVAGGSGRILDSGTGLINVADNVTLKTHGNIGDPGPSIAPVHVGNATTLATLTEVGDIYIDKAGPLAIAGITSGGGQAFFTTTGAITQTGPILNVGSLHATVSGIGGVTLQNDLNTVSYLDLTAPGALAYHQAADYTVVQATGNGMDFASHGNLNLVAVIAGGPLNIDAGLGDVVVSTTGAISISGPGKVLGRNLSFNLANAVNFTGGSNLVNPGCWELMSCPVL